jgi:hypothetical protein
MTDTEYADYLDSVAIEVDTLLQISKIEKILRDKARVFLVNHQFQNARIHPKDIATYMPEYVIQKGDYPLIRDCAVLLRVHDESLDEGQYESVQREANRLSYELITHIRWLEGVIEKVLEGKLNGKKYKDYLYHGVKIEKFLSGTVILSERYELPPPAEGEVRLWTIEKILAGKENPAKISKKRFAARLKKALERIKDYLRAKGLLKDGEVPTSGETIEIDLQLFSKTPSKQLLEDLIAYPKGVPYSESRHGKDQPKALQRMLRRKNRYPQIAANITLNKGKISLKTFTLKKKG